GLFNLSHRLQYGVEVSDVRTYFYGVNELGEAVQDRRILKQTSLSIQATYPLTRYTRIEGNVGFISRTIGLPLLVTNADGSQGQIIEARSANDPTVGIALSYDATRYKSFGPHGGRRVDISYQYTPDVKEGGTLSRDLSFDGRMYVPISKRTLFA